MHDERWQSPTLIGNFHTTDYWTDKDWQTDGQTDRLRSWIITSRMHVNVHYEQFVNKTKNEFLFFSLFTQFLIGNLTREWWWLLAALCQDETEIYKLNSNMILHRQVLDFHPLQCHLVAKLTFLYFFCCGGNETLKKYCLQRILHFNSTETRLGQWH